MRCVRCDQDTEPGTARCPACGLSLAETLADGVAGPELLPAPGGDAAGSRRDERRRRPRFEPGERVGDRYRIIAKVGQGGMGEIYKADDLKVGQTVALKFLSEGVEDDPERLKLLLAEVRLARQVAHPNVCRVFDVGEVDGRHFLTMEFVDGEDLASLLRRIGRLSQDKAVQVARQICAGLEAAHDQGILHRDLKPANIMLDGRGRAKITDFGLAAFANEITGKDAGSGTPAYMAPEQFEGREVTARSDVYSLGLLLFELFTGHRAIDEESLSQALGSGSAPQPRQLADWPDRLDPVVARVLRRCLEADPARRPPRPQVVAAALPGGNALEAALAAGDTPSPDMVAEAGSSEGLNPRLASGLLVGLLALLFLQPWLSDRSLPDSFPQHPKSPAVLTDRGLELAKAFDLDDGTRASVGLYYWFGRRARERSAGPSPFSYGWRKAPLGTLPSSPFSSYWNDPPADVAGTVRVLMDEAGRTLLLEATPAPREPKAPVDWDAALAELGYRDVAFTPTEPLHRPTVFADERRAWSGHWPGEPEVGLRLEAATLEGRLVWAEADTGGQRPSELMKGGFEWMKTRHLSVPRVLIWIVFPGIAGFLAWRNHRLRRTDLRGAGPVFLIVLACGAALPLSRTPWFNSVRMWNVILSGIQTGMLEAVQTTACYLAIEPYVRRWWPHALVAWTRLASLSRRDPMVGTELLAGLLLGAAAACQRAAAPLAADALGFQDAMIPRLLATFPSDGSMRTVIGNTLFSVASAFFWALLVLLVATLGRVLAGRAWLVPTWLFVTIAFIAVESGMGGGNPVPYVEAGLRAGLLLFALCRFGLLSAAAAVAIYSLLTRVQPTLNAELWFFNAGLLVLGLVAAAGIWAFAAALGDRRLLPETASDRI